MTKQDTGVVSIHGKQYLTVAKRINDFREAYASYGIHTEVISIDQEMVVVKATISDEAGREISSGLAEENRRSSKINSTSALENCETSAVGRALAFFGLAGTEIASADEVAGAISAQGLAEATEFLVRHNEAVRNCYDEIFEIKQKIYQFRNSDGEEHGDAQVARDIADLWSDITNADKEALWMAPSKGGVFTTEERTFLKSNEFAQARKEIAA